MGVATLQKVNYENNNSNAKVDRTENNKLNNKVNNTKDRSK